MAFISFLIQNEAQILNVLTALLFIAAFWKGRAPERACAMTMMGMVVIDRAYHLVFGPSSTFLELSPFHLLLDSVALVAFVAIALHANRVYPLVLAAAQLVSFTAHLVRLTVEPVTGLSYYLLSTIPFWFQLAILALGLIHFVMRSRSLGSYKDWRTVRPPQYRMGYP